MLDNTVRFEDVSEAELEMERFAEVDRHFNDMREELGFDSVWSIDDAGCAAKDFRLLADKVRRVRYQYVREDATIGEIYADLQDGGMRSMAEVTTIAVNGTIEGLWRAAESLIKQSGTHHNFIEDFELQEDGTLILTTGS